MDNKARHFTQVRYILAHRYRYYVLHEPVIDDIVFDGAFNVLKKLEEKGRGLVTKYSPTQYVQEPPIGWDGYFAMPREKAFRLFYKRDNNV